MDEWAIDSISFLLIIFIFIIIIIVIIIIGNSNIIQFESCAFFLWWVKLERKQKHTPRGEGEREIKIKMTSKFCKKKYMQIWCPLKRPNAIFNMNLDICICIIVHIMVKTCNTKLSRKSMFFFHFYIACSVQYFIFVYTLVMNKAQTSKFLLFVCFGGQTPPLSHTKKINKQI